MIAADLVTTEDPEPIYAQMRPDVRTAIGEQFIRVFRLSDDPEARRMAEEAARTFSVPKEMLSPGQVAALHRYARQHHPDLFAEVMQHPVTVNALAPLGVLPASKSGQRERGHRNGSSGERSSRTHNAA